jgi:hypothetical protein
MTWQDVQLGKLNTKGHFLLAVSMFKDGHHVDEADGHHFAMLE